MHTYDCQYISYLPHWGKSIFLSLCFPVELSFPFWWVPFSRNLTEYGKSVSRQFQSIKSIYDLHHLSASTRMKMTNHRTSNGFGVNIDAFDIWFSPHACKHFSSIVQLDWHNQNFRWRWLKYLRCLQASGNISACNNETEQTRYYAIEIE